ncbi:MAG TPA: GNAT family N-acetyltransferase [Allosphingosinicella sp.]|nr:GNAT family N-acetyltransferase [Allosphingosinicella sp.]
MTGPLVFRDAEPDDAAALAALARLTFSETFGHLYSAENLDAFLAGHSEEKWRRQLEDPRFTVRIGEADGEAAAYATVGPPSLPIEANGPAAELKQFYVRGPWHGSGAAAEMMDWVLEEARRRGAKEVFLSVFIDNHRARRFYERYGFEAVGRFDFMVGSHVDEDVIMRLRLES